MYSEHCSFTRKTTRRMTESRKEGLESFQGRGGFKSRWHRLATLFMFFHRRFPLPLIWKTVPCKQGEITTLFVFFGKKRQPSDEKG